MDANILACRDRIDLLHQLAESKAYVNFNQGLDARCINEEVAELLRHVKLKRVHFAFDLMWNEDKLLKGLKLFKEITKFPQFKCIVYILTNYNTTIEEDLYRVQKVQELGYDPDVRVYMKSTAPRVVRDLQRWCNNRFIFKSCSFMDYVPRVDGKTIRELYGEINYESIHKI